MPTLICGVPSRSRFGCRIILAPYLPAEIFMMNITIMMIKVIGMIKVIMMILMISVDDSVMTKTVAMVMMMIMITFMMIKMIMIMFVIIQMLKITLVMFKMMMIKMMLRLASIFLFARLLLIFRHRLNLHNQPS